jgi:Rac GTPase-activating protein 1
LVSIYGWIYEFFILQGVIADYTPLTHPMVPALIQHCINEIEIRSLNVVGLYRIPGSEREVKALKERFLRGKGVPNLSNIDPHVICGCIKDFLRSLREPLVGRWFRRAFATAMDISDPIKRQAEFHRTLDELPPPNQDTLAFLILHLQRFVRMDVNVRTVINFVLKIPELPKLKRSRCRCRIWQKYLVLPSLVTPLAIWMPTAF